MWRPQMLQKGLEVFKSWAQTLAIILTLVLTIGSKVQTINDRITTLETIAKQHNERIASGEEVRKLSAENQAKLIELTTQMKLVLERHRIEDEVKFKQLGVKN